MSMFKVGNTYGEWIILLDTFNNEILQTVLPLKQEATSHTITVLRS